jgi:hypothetical protein
MLVIKQYQKHYYFIIIFPSFFFLSFNEHRKFLNYGHLIYKLLAIEC